MGKIGQKKIEAGGFVSSVWQFDGSGGPLPYRWYGTLPEQLIERVLDLYSPSSGIFLDPFAGTGTSLVLAGERGLDVLGLDVNPLACLISRLRLSKAPNRSTINSALARIHGRCDNIKETSFDDFMSDKKYEYCRKWWRMDSLIDTLSLFDSIAQEPDPIIQSIFFVAASEEVRNVANIDPRCTHHLVTKKKDYIDIKTGLAEEVDDVMKCLEHHRISVAGASVVQADSTDPELEIGKSSLVLAHPPYLGMINYHLIHRLQTDILCYISESRNPESLQGLNFKNESIKSDDVSTDSERKYSTFVSRFADRMSDVVDSDGKCVLVIGDQRNKGLIRHPFTKFIAEFERVGFRTEEIFIWVLQNNAGMHITRRGNFIDHNYVIVFNMPTE